MVPRGRMAEGIVREFRTDMSTLPYLTCRTNKDVLDSTGNVASSVWSNGEEPGEEDTCARS